MIKPASTDRPWRRCQHHGSLGQIEKAHVVNGVGIGGQPQRLRLDSHPMKFSAELEQAARDRIGLRHAIGKDLLHARVRNATLARTE